VPNATTRSCHRRISHATGPLKRSLAWSKSRNDGRAGTRKRAGGPCVAALFGYLVCLCGVGFVNLRRSSSQSSDPTTGCRRATSRPGSAGATARGQPGLTKFAALFFRGASPDARLLVGCECELQTGLDRLASEANSFGRVDLLDCRPRSSDREEEIRLSVAASSDFSPVVHIPLNRAVPHEGHGVPPPGTVMFPVPCRCELFHMIRRRLAVCSKRAVPEGGPCEPSPKRIAPQARNVVLRGDFC
jgi:hypothetical protein